MLSEHVVGTPYVLGAWFPGGAPETWKFLNIVLHRATDRVPSGSRSVARCSEMLRNFEVFGACRPPESQKVKNIAKNELQNGGFWDHFDDFLM